METRCSQTYDNGNAMFQSYLSKIFKNVSNQSNRVENTVLTICAEDSNYYNITLAEDTLCDGL